LKRLIVTADDFGAAREVNDAVEAAHRGGVLTAASLMIGAPAAADAIARARRLNSLRVGLHLTLLQGRPVLPAAAVARLIDREGTFPSNPAVLGLRLAASREARRQLAAEISAQFAAFSDSGLALDHCNAHLHFHLHPLVGRLMVAIGTRFGLRAVRLPLEPGEVLPMHTHRRDHVIVVIEGGDLEVEYGDGRRQAYTPRQGDVHFGQVDGAAADTHDARNVGTTRYRNLIIELKDPRRA